MTFEKLNVAEKYIVLALAADKFAKKRSLVFHYYGPKSLERFVGAWEEKGKVEVINRLSDLKAEVLESVPDVPPIFRSTYIASQISSLKNLLEIGEEDMTGEELSQAVQNVLGVEVAAPYDMEFEKYKVDRMLERYGYKTYDGFLKEQNSGSHQMETKDIEEQIEYLKICCWKDIAPHIFCGEEMAEFMDKSEVKIILPKKNEPPDYYLYKGDGKTIVGLSKHHRKTKFNLIRTLFHELYPGHHFYYLYRDLLHRLGYLGEEVTLDLLYSSETPISEGIAETALNFLDSMDPEFRTAIDIATTKEHFSKKVLYNAWYLHFVDGSLSKDQTIKYIADEGDYKLDRAKIWYKFLDEWRIYYPSYPIGTEIVKESIAANSKASLFYFYLPKSLPVLNRLNEWVNQCPPHKKIWAGEGGRYEESSSETNVYGAIEV